MPSVVSDSILGYCVVVTNPQIGRSRSTGQPYVDTYSGYSGDIYPTREEGYAMLGITRCETETFRPDGGYELAEIRVIPTDVEESKAHVRAMTDEEFEALAVLTVEQAIAELKRLQRQQEGIEVALETPTMRGESLRIVLAELAHLREELNQARKVLREIANDWRTERGIKLLDNVIRGEAVLSPVDIERLQGRLLNIQEHALAVLGESPVDPGSRE